MSSALLVVWACAASCANEHNTGNAGSAGNTGGSSGVASSARVASSASVAPGMASASGGDGGAGKGEASLPGSDAAVVQSPLPGELLRSIVGCWRLGDREEWTIRRTEQGGARVTRRLLTAEGDPDYARRAATQSNILYDPKKSTLAFSTAGPQHALLFVFSAGSAGLTGNWASSHAPGDGYHLTGNNVTLRSCSGTGAP